MELSIKMNAEEALHVADTGALARFIECVKNEEPKVTAEAPKAEVAHVAPKAEAPKVPTQEKTYTPDELAKAGVSLLDKGKQADLLALLGDFNVAAIPALKPEQYGEFALRLREMGAEI